MDDTVRGIYALGIELFVRKGLIDILQGMDARQKEPGMGFTSEDDILRAVVDLGVSCAKVRKDLVVVSKERVK